ncbi:hypothetical protein [Lysobacter gummosus]
MRSRGRRSRRIRERMLAPVSVRRVRAGVLRRSRDLPARAQRCAR